MSESKPKVCDWVDAQQMALKYPDTFDAPTADELAAIRPGMYVKINPGNERFWVMVLTHEPPKLTGTIDNNLVCTETHGLVFGNVVEFEERHVYAISEPPEVVKPAVGNSRNQIALQIQGGACNPYAITHALLDAIRQSRVDGDPAQDPACRLIVHQLAHLFQVGEINDSLDLYGKLMEQCAAVLPPLPRISQSSIDACQSIQKQLDGAVWDYSDLEDVAEILRKAGYPITEVKV